MLRTHSCEPSLQVKEEITTVAEESEFQDVSEKGIVELLESHSVLLMNEELAGLTRQTYK